MTQNVTDNNKSTIPPINLPASGETFVSPNQMILNLNAYAGLTFKGIRRLVRIWTQTIVPPAINTTLYLLVFGAVIGARLGNAHEYSQFIIPGLLMMVVINGSYMNNAFESFMLSFMKTKEELFIAPISMHTVLWSFISTAMVRAVFSVVVILIIANLISPIAIQYVFIAILVILLTVIVFSLLGFINGIFAKNFEQVNFIPTFILSPLTFLSGVFYSIDQLGPIYQTISLFNPLVYIIDTIRFSFLGNSGINIWLSLLLLFMLSIILYIITYKLALSKMKD